MYTPSLLSLFHTQRAAPAQFVLNDAHDHWTGLVDLSTQGSRPLVACVEVVLGWQTGTIQHIRANQIQVWLTLKKNHAHVRKKRVCSHTEHRHSLEQVCAKFCRRIEICSVPASFFKVLCCILPIIRMVLGRRKIDTCAGSQHLNKQG